MKQKMFYGLVLSTKKKLQRIYLVMVKRRSVCLCEVYVTVTSLSFICTDTWNFSDITQCPDEGVSLSACKFTDFEESKN